MSNNIRFRFKKGKNKTYAYEFTVIEPLPEDTLNKLIQLSVKQNNNSIFHFNNEKNFRTSINLSQKLSKQTTNID